MPAAKKLHSGDVIVSALGKPTKTPEQLRAASSSTSSPVPTSTCACAATARSAPSRCGRSSRRPEHGRAIIGIRVAQAANIKLPLKVDIDLGRVGGPSAGLPFALDVYQELGRNVDHGRRVVATGEIALDGSVGPIGGVKQKTFGARAAHADVFLVPAGENAAEARRYAGNLRIIPVESFQQALSALRTLRPNSPFAGIFGTQGNGR